MYIGYQAQSDAWRWNQYSSLRCAVGPPILQPVGEGILERPSPRPRRDATPDPTTSKLSSLPHRQSGEGGGEERVNGGGEERGTRNPSMHVTRVPPEGRLLPPLGNLERTMQQGDAAGLGPVTHHLCPVVRPSLITPIRPSANPGRASRRRRCIRCDHPRRVRPGPDARRSPSRCPWFSRQSSDAHYEQLRPDLAAPISADSDTAPCSPSGVPPLIDHHSTPLLAAKLITSILASEWAMPHGHHKPVTHACTSHPRRGHTMPEDARHCWSRWLRLMLRTVGARDGGHGGARTCDE